MRVRFFAALCAGALGFGATSAFAHPPKEVPFVLEGRSFVNKKAFIDAGLRCGARHVDEDKAA
ncbi:hypothetical protein HNQ51_000712 [Inhella inkyongensis]|uniref:Uncharacterized protein n=1 Tax=Inhella inkyongensis TaxID=392593 RepID=A0A840S4I8_9BURK|nr:hypothetical protein [Inhella inkyongensis]